MDKVEQRARELLVAECPECGGKRGYMVTAGDEGYWKDCGTCRDGERLESVNRSQALRAIAAVLREQAGAVDGERDAARWRFYRQSKQTQYMLGATSAEEADEVADRMLAAAPSPPVEQAAGGGVALIAAERRRQVEAEGWTPEHDDEHSGCELAEAAACYATFAALSDVRRNSPGTRERMLEEWPWEPEWWKPTSRIRDLVKAGALIAAEIERLQRATGERHG